MRYLLLLVMLCLSVEATPPNLLRELGARRRAAAQVAFPTNGLVAYWSFDSVSGNTVEDTFGDNDGTAVGEPLFGTEYGVNGDGVRLVAAETQSITVTHDDSLNFTASSFSISAWFNTSTTGVRQFIASKRDENTGDGGYSLRVNEDSKIRAGVGRGGNNTFFSTIGTYADGQWHHVVFVGSRDANAMYLYVNGVLDATSGAWSTRPMDTTNNFTIGNEPDSVGFFNGSLDEIAIWNRALTDDEVSEIYNDGKGRFYTP